MGESKCNKYREIDFIIANKIRTIHDVKVFNKFRTNSNHRMLRATIILDFEFERLKLIKKLIISKIIIENWKENIENYPETPNKKATWPGE